MTPEDYERAAKRADKNNQEYRDDQDRLSHYAMGIAGEAGEVVDLIKKHIYGLKPLDADMTFKLKQEIGDMLWYLFRTLDVMHCDLGEIMAMNAAKLETRYPDDRAKYATRNTAAERQAMTKARASYLRNRVMG